MNNGRGTIFEPCINTLYVKENCQLAHIGDDFHPQRCNNGPLFIKTKDDDKIGTPVEDDLDGELILLPNSEQGIDVITGTHYALNTEGNSRLHNITWNSSDEMKAFPSDYIGKDLQNLNLCEDYYPVQHSLGLTFDLNSDSFIFTPIAR